MPYKSRIPAITRQLEIDLRTAVNRAGYMVEAGAKRRARFDTGYMRGQIRWIPERGGLRGEVIGGAEYTIFHEFGFHAGDTYVPPQPMFTPAAEEVRPIFLQEVKSAIRKAVKSA